MPRSNFKACCLRCQQRNSAAETAEPSKRYKTLRCDLRRQQTEDVSFVEKRGLRFII